MKHSIIATCLFVLGCVQGCSTQEQVQAWKITYQNRSVYTLSANKIESTGRFLKEKESAPKGNSKIDVFSVESNPLYVAVLDWTQFHKGSASVDDTLLSCSEGLQRAKRDFDKFFDLHTDKASVGYFYFFPPQKFCDAAIKGHPSNDESYISVDNQSEVNPSDQERKSDDELRCSDIINKFESLFESSLPVVFVVHEKLMNPTEGLFSKCINNEGYEIQKIDEEYVRGNWNK